MKDNRDIVALLPIKGHSARVPGKNFRDLNGKPLFAWILDALMEVSYIRQVVINTDAIQTFEDFKIAQHYERWRDVPLVEE